MGNGPSPLVPSLLVLAWGLVIFGPTLMENVSLLFQVFECLIPLIVFVLVLLLVVGIFDKLFPSAYLLSAVHQQPGSSSHEADGFGWGSLLLFLLFLVLYNLM
uniref:Transmembrane protein n=1 Tax=Nelumbo nucifera TaxID=4432 RepID=A0A822XHF5_NELNU|nr:TPA_asm: hypothetical protein HUJ06_020855 [Nelumbo nucifera]